MADTLDAFEIGGTWTDLNALTGITAGTEIYLQNIGAPNAVLDVATGAGQPAVDFNGVRIQQNSPMYKVSAGESTVWIRYIRLDRQDVGVRTSKVQVQVA